MYKLTVAHTNATINAFTAGIFRNRTPGKKYSTDIMPSGAITYSKFVPIKHKQINSPVPPKIKSETSVFL